MAKTGYLIESGGRRFRGTFSANTKQRKEAESYAATLHGIVESFGVKITEWDEKTETVTAWRKVSGYSVWV